MITVTLTINGVTTDKQLPTNWGDVTWDQFVELSKIGFGVGNTYFYAKYYLGIGAGNKLHEDSISPVVRILSFLQWPEQMLVQPVNSTVNINAEPWSKLEQAKAAMQIGEGKMFNCGAQIVKIYTDEDVTKKPVTYALPLIAFFLRSWTSSSKIMRNSTRALARRLKNKRHDCRTQATTLWRNLAGWLRSTR